MRARAVGTRGEDFRAGEGPILGAVFLGDRGRRKAAGDPHRGQEQSRADLPPWRKGRWGKYSQKRYWRMVGRPLLEEALANPGWWVAILDPDLARATWKNTKGVADALVVAHLVGLSSARPSYVPASD